MKSSDFIFKKSPPPSEAFDAEMMQLAIELAGEAEARDEVPIGALIVYGGEIIAKASNLRETEKIATSHAELLAIEEACRVRGGWRLHGCTLYVTLEPCAMCAGAAINARLDRVVFGAYDKRFGAMGSLCDLPALPFNHRLCVTGGVLETECAAMLSAYFKKKRT